MLVVKNKKDKVHLVYENSLMYADLREVIAWRNVLGNEGPETCRPCTAS